MAQPWQGRIRPAIRQSVEDAITLLVVVVGLLLSPILIPLAIIWGTSHQKRKRVAADSFRCTACGWELGENAVHFADAQWEAFTNRLHEENPGIRFRLIRWFHAICGRCGQRYRYDESVDSFTPVKERETCLSATTAASDHADASSHPLQEPGGALPL